jgi:hypothetical protein
MPETSVDKYRNTRIGKHEIGAAENWPFSTPAGNSVPPKKRDQPEFGRTVSMALDARHYVGALLR